jgi:hypothetical protein
MHIQIIIIMAMAAITATASTEGVNAVVKRRKAMRPLERRVVAQRMEHGVMLSTYDDGNTSTAAVSVVRMAPSTKARVAQLVDDRDTLKAARGLADKVRKGKHAKEVEALTDAQLVAVGDDVLDTSTKDQAAAGVIGAALGAALAAIKGKKKKGKA